MVPNHGIVLHQVPDHIPPKVITGLLWCIQGFPVVCEDVEVFHRAPPFYWGRFPNRANLDHTFISSPIRLRFDRVVDLKDNRKCLVLDGADDVLVAMLLARMAPQKSLFILVVLIDHQPAR